MSFSCVLPKTEYQKIVIPNTSILTLEFQTKGTTGTQISNQYFVKKRRKKKKKNARAANRQTLILYQVCKIDIRDC